MDKLGLRVETHSAAVQAERGVAQVRRRNSGNANVDRFAQHVLAVLGDSGRGVPQEFVTPARAIAADNINFYPGASHGGGEIAEKVKNPGIQVDHVTRAVVPEEMIELFYRVRDIRFTPAVNDIDSLLRVQVVKQQAVFRQRKLTSSRNG